GFADIEGRGVAVGHDAHAQGAAPLRGRSGRLGGSPGGRALARASAGGEERAGGQQRCSFGAVAQQVAPTQGTVIVWWRHRSSSSPVLRPCGWPPVVL